MTALETVAASAVETAPEMEVIDVAKRFGTLVALDGVSLRLPPGAFHALLGENGAGKSTLVKCIMGYHAPDRGTVVVGGVQRVIATPRDAHALGIGMVYQHFTLVPNMTVAENLLIARADIAAVVEWRRERERMERFLRRMPFRIDLAAPVSSLAAGEKQKVEILKQLFLDCQVLILDEPTSVLTPEEANQVLNVLHDMTRTRRLSVLLITHKMREVMAFAEDVTVLRHGRMTGTGAVRELGAARLSELMVGSHEVTALARRSPSAGSKVRLRIERLCAENDRGHVALRDVSFEVRSGEIVGIAGVSGNGQKELVEVLAGQRMPRAGTITVNGEAYAGTRAEMHRHRLFCLPEEPLRNACVPAMSVAENLAFRRFDQAPFVVARYFVNRRAMRSAARTLIGHYRIKASSPDVPAESLSGGNVQRMVLARELSGSVQVLVAANPCFGLDIRAIAEIHDQIMRARNRGAAVLLVSEDLDELFELAERLLVFFDGRIVAEAQAAVADRAAIGQYMAGH
jgi:general nucleoside transport system ATP-binding protein